MGLFDRLFGKKEKTEKVLPTSEEVTENKEQEVADTEEPKAVSQDRDEQKISDMEAYYQELKSGLQPHINLFQQSLKKSHQRNLLLKKKRA